MADRSEENDNSTAAAPSHAVPEDAQGVGRERGVCRQRKEKELNIKRTREEMHNRYLRGVRRNPALRSLGDTAVNSSSIFPRLRIASSFFSLSLRLLGLRLDSNLGGYCLATYCITHFDYPQVKGYNRRIGFCGITVFRSLPSCQGFPYLVLCLSSQTVVWTHHFPFCVCSYITLVRYRFHSGCTSDKCVVL